MFKTPMKVLLIIVLLSSLLSGNSLLMAAGEPLKLHPSNGHYFMFRGQPTILVTSGEHYGSVINSGFNYTTYLNELQNKGLNLTRTFTGPYVEVNGDFGIVDNTLAPTLSNLHFPWARSSTPGYVLGGNKFDLTIWDTNYWNRLKDFVQQASDRGIVIEINLFCVFYDSNSWNRCPFNPSNNVNGYGTCGSSNALTMNNGNLGPVEDAYVQKIVTELKDFDNVYYEICNEPYGGSVSGAWQDHMISVIVNTESLFTYRHLISLNIANGSTTVSNPNSNVSIFNYHYCQPPDAVAWNYGLNKVIGYNESGFNGVNDEPYRQQGWNFIIAGGGLFNNLDYSFTTSHPDGTYVPGGSTPGGGSPALRTSYKALANFMKSFDFQNMTPNNLVITGGVPNAARALVQSGQQYAIYLDGGSQANLQVNLPAGSYTAEWVNTKTGNLDKSENISNHPGGNRTISSPNYTSDIALRIKRTGGPTATPIPTTAPGSFVKGINLNGNAVIIEGNNWLSYSTAQSQGFSTSATNVDTTSLIWSPPADTDTSSMLNSVIWSLNSFTMSQTITSGSYNVYFWMVENYQNNYRSMNVKLEGTQVASGIGNLVKNAWQKYGPYNVTVSDGVLNINIDKVTGDPVVAGMAIFAAGGGATSTPTPTATPTPGATTTPTPTATPTPTTVPGTWTRVDHTHSSAVYNGTWNTWTNAGCYGGSSKYSNINGNYVEYTFTGTGARWICEKGTDHGKANVYVDENLKVAGLDTYNSSALFQQNVYEITGLTNGSHILRIEVTNQKNAGSTGYNQSTDAFEYYTGGSTPTATPTPTPSGSTRYEVENATLNGTTIANNCPGYSGTGHTAWFGDLGDYVTYSINVSGSGSRSVTVRYSRGDSGNATLSVYVNGVHVQNISFPSTGGWSTWSTGSANLSLNSGANTIQYKYDSGDSGYINMDCLDVSN